MFDFFIRRKKAGKAQKREMQQDPVFKCSGIIDVTFFDVHSPDDPLGYVCAGSIRVFSDGTLVIYSTDGKSILESIRLTNLICASNNINSFDPASITKVSLMTENRDIRIDFQNMKTKKKFWNSITAVYDSLKAGSDGKSRSIGYRFDETGIFGYAFYSDGGRICTSSSITAPSAPVMICGDCSTWRSDFDQDTTIFPGLARRILDSSDGTQLFHIVYKDDGKYEINESVTVFCDSGQYTFCRDGKEIAEINRLTGKTDSLPTAPDTDFDYVPYFEAAADEGISTEWLMVILSFPMLQFAF